MSADSSSQSEVEGPAKIIDFKKLQTLANGTLVVVEGIIDNLTPRIEVKQKKKLRHCQQLTLKSLVNDSSACVVVWGSDELQTLKGQRVVLTGGIYSDDQIFVSQRSRLTLADHFPPVPPPDKPIIQLPQAIDELRHIAHYVLRGIKREEFERLSLPVLVDICTHDEHERTWGLEKAAPPSSESQPENTPKKVIEIKCSRCEKIEQLEVTLNFEGIRALPALQHEGHMLVVRIDNEGNIRRTTEYDVL